VHGLLAGRVPVAGSILPVGPYAVNLPPSDFNPEAARHLLDQAGWVVGSDGVRGKDGVRAHVTLFTSTGDILAEETTQVVEADLQAVGIETETKEVPTLALAGGFASNSPLNLGSFDLAVFGPVEQIDPQAFLNNHYSSKQVPNPELQTGSNLDRIQDPSLDQALAAAGGTLDDAQRRAAYVSASQLIRADEAVIPLYQRLTVDARRSYLQGWRTNVGDYVTWNIQDWWLNQ
jgi:peptide/nickel transport system substrate-binding protein